MSVHDEINQLAGRVSDAEQEIRELRARLDKIEKPPAKKAASPAGDLSTEKVTAPART